MQLDMMNLHDKTILMRANVTTLTERGQTSLPARLRKELGLKPGQKLRWQRLTARECLVRIEPGAAVPGPRSMLGYARKTNAAAVRRTADWMRELRAGESA